MLNDSHVAGLQAQIEELQRQLSALRRDIEGLAPPVAPTRAAVSQHAARPPPRSRDAVTTTADEQTPKLQRFIRLADLPAYVGVRRTQIAELMKAGEFPKPISISDVGRAVAWLEVEVLAWQVKRIAKRQQVEDDTLNRG